MKDTIYSEIVEVLKFKTKKGSIDWEEDGASPTLFTRVSCTVGNQTDTYRIGIFRIEEENIYMVQLPGSVCAELSFIDEDGKVFDKVSIYTTSSTDYKNLSELYELARQKASGASQRLKQILSSLKNQANAEPDPHA